jgi:hypothetical protein
VCRGEARDCEVKKTTASLAKKEKKMHRTLFFFLFLIRDPVINNCGSSTKNVSEREIFSPLFANQRKNIAHGFI